MSDTSNSSANPTNSEEVTNSENATAADIPPPPPPGADDPEDNPEDYKPTKVVRRAEWGAQKPKWIDALQYPINKVAVSFTETDTCFTEEECVTLIREMQKKHMEEPDVPDIKHNFLIGGDGVIYEGRGYTRVGPVYAPSPKKIEQLNGKSIDIAFIERSTHDPPKRQMRSVSYLFAEAASRNYIVKDFTTYYLVKNEIVHVEKTDPKVFEKVFDPPPGKR